MWTKTLQVGCASALIALSSGVVAGDKFGVELSGQVNRALLFADDGLSSETFFVDNDASSTRFRIVTKAKMSDDVTVGAQLETQHESNSTGDVSIYEHKGDKYVETGRDARSANAFTERKLEIYFDSKMLGRLWLGQGSMASDGVATYDLSGTSLVGGASITDTNAGLMFREDRPGIQYTFSGVTIGDLYDTLEGGRDDRIRYDTPDLGGFKLSVAAGTGEKYDIGLHFERGFGDIEVAAGLGFQSREGSDDTRFAGSVSAKFRGFNVTLAGGSQGDIDDTVKDKFGDDKDLPDEPLFYYAKLGYQFKASPLGKTSFSIDYGRGENFNGTEDAMDSYGLQFVQKIDKVATELYLGIRNNQFDNDSTNSNIDYEDILTVIGGARVKF